MSLFTDSDNNIIAVRHIVSVSPLTSLDGKDLTAYLQIGHGVMFKVTTVNGSTHYAKYMTKDWTIDRAVDMAATANDDRLTLLKYLDSQ